MYEWHRENSAVPPHVHQILTKKLVFQQSSSPALGFPSLWKSLKLQGSDFCPGFISALKAAGVGISPFSRLGWNLKLWGWGLTWGKHEKLNLQGTGTQQGWGWMG